MKARHSEHCFSKRGRHGFSLVELLVVAGVVGALVAILLPAIQQVRESGNRALCCNNFKQMGIALHAYCDSYGVFPSAFITLPEEIPGITPQRHVFNLLRDYMELSNNDGVSPAKIYLCPSRRYDIRFPKGDYGIPDKFFYTRKFLPSVIGWNSQQSSTNLGYQSKVALDQGLTRMSDIMDGTTNTLLLSHKGIDPLHYYKSPPPPVPIFPEATLSFLGPNRDFGWMTDAMEASLLWFDIMRFPYCLLQDRAGGYDLGLNPNNGILLGTPKKVFCYELMTSPHRVSMPMLWADGTVRSMAYSKNHSFPKLFTKTVAPPSYDYIIPPEASFLVALWVHNDGVQVPNDMLGE